jgi:hypothetical protein
MMRNDRLLLLSLLIACGGLFVLGLACQDSAETPIAFNTPNPNDQPRECTCAQTIKLLYDKCGRILNGQDGLPIDAEDAVTGCGICEGNPDQYPIYCCIRDCCGANKTCAGNDEEDGMNTCVDGCVDQYAPPPTPTPEPSPTPSL